MDGNVAIIMERADIALGGAERSVLELATSLSARGLKVDVFAATGRLNTRSIHVVCPDSPRKRVSLRTFAKALRPRLAEKRYDIVHSVLPLDFADIYHPRGGTYAESVLRSAASYRNALMRSYKRLTAFANRRRTNLLGAERRLCRNADGPVIVALSKYVAAQLKQHYATAAERIVVIPNGVRTDKRINTHEADSLRTQILTHLNLKEADNPVLLLFVANNFRLKGLGPLIEAMSIAVRSPGERPGYLVAIGAGRTRRYRRLAARLGIKNRILFLGPVPHIQNALSVTDVAALPTYYDPSSRYVLEAIAAGKPVITTSFNGAADLFTHTRHGMVVDSPDNIPELARAIVHFSSTDNIRSASEAIVEDNLKQRVSVARVADRLVSLYESILQKKGRR